MDSGWSPGTTRVKREALEKLTEVQPRRTYRRFTLLGASIAAMWALRAEMSIIHLPHCSKLRRQVRDWLTACNFAKQLKALDFRTP